MAENAQATREVLEGAEGVQPNREGVGHLLEWTERYRMPQNEQEKSATDAKAVKKRTFQQSPQKEAPNSGELLCAFPKLYLTDFCDLTWSSH